jgi:hypothetical protein
MSKGQKVLKIKPFTYVSGKGKGKGKGSKVTDKLIYCLLLVW